MPIFKLSNLLDIKVVTIVPAHISDNIISYNYGDRVNIHKNYPVS